jgi:hypothetical protein
MNIFITPDKKLQQFANDHGALLYTKGCMVFLQRCTENPLGKDPEPRTAFLIA